MDSRTLDIEPLTAPASEGDGVNDDAIPGKRRCIVVVPKQAATGNPWSWRGCYWNHEPQTEVELLRRGYFIAYCTPDPQRQGPAWDAWYQFLVAKHGFAEEAVFIGMSRGGANAYNWAVKNPTRVACIYADNPGIYPEDLEKLHLLAEAGVPLFHVCGSFDFLLYRHTLPIEDIYHLYGGEISLMIKEGYPHHPHSLPDAKPIADWIEQNDRPSPAPSLTLPGLKLIKTHYYSFQDTFQFFPSDNAYITCRGPAFTNCYDRYDAAHTDFPISGVTIIRPQKAAPGNPWVFRADRIDRSEPSPVDLGLLAKGFAIVAAPLDAQTGPSQKEWDATYTILTENGFAKKPALEGTGMGAGEAYAWAVHNPDKVSCIYAVNPLMRSIMFPDINFKDLTELFKAQIPLLHVCGSLDPLLKGNSSAVETDYKRLGGQITVLMNDGDGHFPLEPTASGPVIDFIAKSAGK